MQVDRTKRWIAKWRKKDGSAIYRRYFAGDLHPNAWSDEISLKRTLIDQAKSYRLVCRLMKFIKKIIELFGVELKEFVGAQRANGFDKRRDTWKVAPSIISFFKKQMKKKINVHIVFGLWKERASLRHWQAWHLARLGLGLGRTLHAVEKCGKRKPETRSGQCYSCWLPTDRKRVVRPVLNKWKHFFLTQKFKWNEFAFCWKFFQKF